VRLSTRNALFFFPSSDRSKAIHHPDYLKIQINSAMNHNSSVCSLLNFFSSLFCGIPSLAGENSKTEYQIPK
jgi:hypothetical protein